MAKGIVIEIKADGAGVDAALRSIDARIRETAENGKRSGDALASSLNAAKSALASIGVGITIGAAIGELKQAVTSSLEFGQAIENAHLKTGLAVGTLSTLHYAAAITGNDFETLTVAVGRMDKQIGAATEGDKKAQAFMKALGLNAQELANRSDGAEIAFRKFAATLASTENPIRRVELATSLLGRAGAAQVPVLMEIGNNWDYFKQKATDAGVQLDGKTATALADTNQRLNDLKQHIMGAGIAFTEGLIPGLVELWSVIAGGSTPMEALKEFGTFVARTAAFATASVYELVSAQEALNAVLLEASGDEGSAKAQWLRMKEDDAKAMRAAEIAVNGPSASVAPFGPTPPAVPRGGFGGVGDLDPKKPKPTNGIAEAAAQLAEANSTAEADAIKADDELVLAQMEADHKLFLSSDTEYYAQKLIFQKRSNDAEADALRARLTELAELEAKQHADKKLVRDKSGESAEELKTAREMVQLRQQLGQLDEKNAALDVEAKLGERERADAVHLASLRAAATIEENINGGIAARLALMEREQEIAMQKATSEGGDTKTLAALQAQERELLKINDLERQINATKAAGALSVGAQKDREDKDPTQRKAATKEINLLNEQTAATLKSLVAQYDALAATLGGEFIEKARALHAELDQLNRPDKKQEMKPVEELTQGLTSMAEKMAEATGRGREGFHSMVMSMERDLVELAVKFAAQKWLAPFMNSLGQKSGGDMVNSDIAEAMANAHAGGGYMDSPGLVGEQGPELFVPSRPGTIIPNAALSQLSKSGGGGMPSVTMNVTNASSQPLTARQTGTSFDSDMKAFVIHTILEDHASGGPISAASQGS